MRQLLAVLIVSFACQAASDPVYKALREAGIQLSDRRIVKSQRLIAAAALLRGQRLATEADLWPLLYVLPTREIQQHGREVLQDLFAQCLVDGFAEDGYSFGGLKHVANAGANHRVVVG